jgi:hypothetical protein
MECVGVTMVFAPTLLGVSWHSYSPTPGVSLLRTYDEAEGEVDRKAAVRVSGVFEGRLAAALASIKANLAAAAETSAEPSHSCWPVGLGGWAGRAARRGAAARRDEVASRRGLNVLEAKQPMAYM